MIDHRPFSGLPNAKNGWLTARHHFPVNGLADPQHMPVKSLYVWNDDDFARLGHRRMVPRAARPQRPCLPSRVH